MSTPPLHLTLHLRVSAETPLSVGAAGSQGGLVDKSIQLDGWYRPIIPGSQVKGRLRHTCERLARALGHPVCGSPVAAAMCPDAPSVARVTNHPELVERAKRRNNLVARQCVVCALFGSPAFPAPLRFSDLVHTPFGPEDAGTTPTQRAEANLQLRTVVGLDRRRRTALEQVLYTVETTAEGVVFGGDIQGTWHHTDAQTLRPLLALLVAGVQESRRWGGGSSRGLGWARTEVVALHLGGEKLEAAALLAELGGLGQEEATGSRL